MVNIIATGGLAMQESRVSAAMVLTYFSWNIPVSAPDGLTNADHSAHT